MHLFSEGRIGTLQLRNRIVMPAIATRLASEGGKVTERMIRYYTERAKGGAGLIIVEYSCVAEQGKGTPFQLMVDRDDCVPGLQRLASAIHRHGVKTALQIQHGGLKASAEITRMQPVAPSVIPSLQTEAALGHRALTLKEIQDLIHQFGKAALRAKIAGFDAIELHATHSYLIDQFISPRFNKRTDVYGGSLKNRARFACEIVEEVKRRLGPDFPLICRITGDDYVEGGIRLEDASATAALLVDSGADSIHVSVGISDNMVSTPPMSFPKGCFVHLAEGIKRAVDVPVIAVGRIGDIRFAETILAERKADYIAMGRALIADPHLPRKGEKGEDDNILPCIYCNQGCITTVKANRPISCLVNPGAGREAEFEIEPASPPKRVLIAGAGPAGLEASRTSALRGHRVSLYEKSGAIGGQLDIAWIPPHKMEVKRLLDYYQVQMEKLGVDLHLNSEVTPGLIEEIHPDILVIATGSIPKIPEVPGFGTTDVKLAVDILKDRIRITGRVIVLGSRRVAMETAEYMMETATEVTLLGRADGIGLDLPQRERLFFLERLAKKGIKIIRSASVMEIQKKGVLFRTGGKDVFHNADHIVLAWGFVPNQSLIRETELMTGHLGIKVYVAGDCIMPRNALEAIHEGARIGIAI